MKKTYLLISLCISGTLLTAEKDADQKHQALLARLKEEREFRNKQQAVSKEEHAAAVSLWEQQAFKLLEERKAFNDQNNFVDPQLDSAYQSAMIWKEAQEAAAKVHDSGNVEKNSKK